MFQMSLALKGKSWAGTIYHQFESICQDVDDFMNKDTVKHVENQVQSVAAKQVNTKDHLNFVTGVNQEQLSVEQGSPDTLKNSSTSLPIEFDHVLQFPKPPLADTSQEAETNFHLTEDGDALIWHDAKICVEENLTRDLIPVTADSSSKNQIFSGTGLLPIKTENIPWNSFTDDVESLYNIPMAEDPNSNENRSSSDKFHEDYSILMDTPRSSPFDPAQAASGEDGVLWDSFSTKDESFNVSASVQLRELVFSYSYSDDEEREMVKSSDILESTSANFTRNTENLCNSRDDTNGCVYDVYTSSSETVVYDADPNDNNASSTGGSVSFESRHEQQGGDAQSSSASSPSETGKTYEVGDGIHDLNMETIDLSTNVKHDGTTVVLNYNFGHAASNRRRNFRYYKKLLQEALASRKRLSKEYEHLAILYGDIDAESRQHFEPSSLPSSSLSFQETCETEWELL